MAFRRAWLGLLGFFLLGLGGCAIAPGLYVENLEVTEPAPPPTYRLIPITAALPLESPPEPSPPKLPAPPYEYRVSPYDVLQITVWDHPELSTTALLPLPEEEFTTAKTTGHYVDSQGQIFFPQLGAQTVAGQTVAEIRQQLTRRLARLVPNPQIAVRVAAYRGKRVQVLGEVREPGGIFLTDTPLHVLEAIGRKGGLTGQADPARAVLNREGDTIPLDLARMISDGDLRQNYLLRDGDVIHVPDNRRQRIFLLGEIKRPTARVIPWRGYSLGDALGEAEGMDLNTADSGRIFVFRQEGDTPVVYHLDARSVEALLLATRFPLRALDVVYVAPTSLARWNRVIQQILPTAKTLWYPTTIARDIDTLQE